MIHHVPRCAYTEYIDDDANRLDRLYREASYVDRRGVGYEYSSVVYLLKVAEAVNVCEGSAHVIVLCGLSLFVPSMK